MTESKAMILGCAGLALTADEIAFYRDERPWAFILFGRNVSEPNQIRDLVAAMRDSVGRPDALVFIDQEGGRVQRLSPPLAPSYPPAAVIEAFRDVQRAAADRERQRNEAEAYRNDIIPRARGEAERMIQEAQGFRDSQEARS